MNEPVITQPAVSEDSPVVTELLPYESPRLEPLGVWSNLTRNSAASPGIGGEIID